jgi:septal ring factor EnvC (AmiA/AmiB activator)
MAKAPAAGQLAWIREEVAAHEARLTALRTGEERWERLVNAEAEGAAIQETTMALRAERLEEEAARDQARAERVEAQAELRAVTLELARTEGRLDARRRELRDALREAVPTWGESPVQEPAS